MLPVPAANRCLVTAAEQVDAADVVPVVMASHAGRDASAID